MKKAKIKTFVAFGLVVIIAIAGLVLDLKADSTDVLPNEDTQIYLYGEIHGIKAYYNIEYEEWNNYYNEGFRNLFLELPYFTAEYLNLWMEDDTDDIIDFVFEDLEGTQGGNEYFYNMLQQIKKNCPQTVFYGTDVGHQYNSTGDRYINYLKKAGLEDSEQYRLAKENIDQGIDFYTIEETDDEEAFTVRENYMALNFKAAYERCGGGKIMGIYGSYHTNVYDSEVMAGQLNQVYRGQISSINLSTLAFEQIEGTPYDIGFCLTGLIFLLMLFIPNIIWAKKAKPENYEESAQKENRILLALERIGEVLVTTSLVIFTGINPKIMFYGGIYSQWRLLIWIEAFILMILYECYWVRYFKGTKTMENFYSAFVGFPVAGATLPVIAVILLGIYSKNLILIAAGIILGIGHIGIHLEHKRNIERFS